MKKLITIALLAFSTFAMADQCQIMDKDAADRASLLIKPGSEIASLCQPCGQKIKDAKVSVVRSVKRNGDELIINGQGADMAYTYIKVAPGKFANVAKVVNCPATDVSSSLSR